MSDPANLVSEVCGAYNNFFDWLRSNPNSTQSEREHQLWEQFEYVHPIAKATEGGTIPEDQVWPEEME